MSGAEKQELWSARIAARAESGLSVAEWCARNDVKQWQYHYWRKRLSAATEPHAGFVRLDPPDGSGGPCKGSGVTLWLSGAQIVVDREFDADCLLRVIGLLGGLQRC